MEAACEPLGRFIDVDVYALGFEVLDVARKWKPPIEGCRIWEGL